MQVFIGILLFMLSAFLFYINIPAIGVILFFIGFGVLRGYRRGKVFYLIGGRSSGGCCH